MGETVLLQMQKIAKQQQKTLLPLTDDLPLLDSGLDSLCIAVLVAVLDDKLGLDPFAADEEAGFPVTVGEFISLYENAAG
jgi:acyl carrier protein